MKLVQEKTRNETSSMEVPMMRYHAELVLLAPPKGVLCKLLAPTVLRVLATGIGD